MSLKHAAPEGFARVRVFLVGVSILMILAVANRNALHAPFVFDDGDAVAVAKEIVSTRSLSPAFGAGSDSGATTSGRPLLTLSLALNYAISAEQVWSYHVVNLTLHALAGFTLLGIIRRTLLLPSQRRTPNTALIVAAGTTALWVLHPLQTQAVTYIVQRAESLMALCYLTTLYTFVRSVDAANPRRWLQASVLAAALGMASKEVMVTAPFMVLLYDRTFVAGTFRRAWDRRKGYYLALAGTLVLLAGLVASTQGRGGTAGFDANVSPWHYFLTQCDAVVHYLRLAGWPHPLVFDYGTSVITRVGAVVGPMLVLTVLAALTLRGLRSRTAWGFAACWWLAILAPTSSVVPIASQTVAEHRIYLALAAPLVLLVSGLHASLGRRCLPVLAALALGSAWLTYERNETYQNAGALWRDTVAKRPQNARAYHNLGLAEFAGGRFTEAETHFRTALTLNPDAAETHYNLGLCLSRLDRPTEAVAAYERALELRPHHVEAHNNLGTTLLALGQPAEAVRHYRRAVELQPTFAAAHSNLGEALLEMGDAPAALRHSGEALRLDPRMPDAHFHAGNACAALGSLAEARRHYEAALQLVPNDPRVNNNLGNILVELGLLTDAIPRYERALSSRPEFVDPRRNLALLLVHLDRFAAAEEHLVVLTRLTPNDSVAQAALQKVRATLRR